jgi:hypothetical protein
MGYVRVKKSYACYQLTLSSEVATLYERSTVVSTTASQPQCPKNLEFYNYDANEPWTEAWLGKFDYIRFAFMDGSIADWDAIVGRVSKTLKPGGVLHITDITFQLESGAWKEALSRMRAYALGAYEDGRCRLALLNAGFEIDDQSQTQELSHGDKIYNDCDLLEAVAERIKRIYVRALQVGPFRQDVQRDLVARLVDDVLQGLRIRM